ncbi:MAG: hypothetical protein AAF280_12790 [Pseudomonadota bacterium]
MIRVLSILLVLTISGTTSVSAGPWPRAHGEGFLSFSLDLDAEDFSDNFLSFYLEYGLSRNRTLVLERQERGSEIGKTFVALRFPVGPPDRHLKLAYDLGGGTVDGHVAARFGLSIGRGWSIGEDPRETPFQWKGKWSGWWSVDTRTLVFDDGVNGIFEADLTFGVQLTHQVKSISQLQAGAPFRGETYAKIAQSFAYQVSDTRHLVLGITAGIHEVEDLHLNLGLWQNF